MSDDTQLPDFSSLPDPTGLSSPRPMGRSRQSESEDLAVATSRHFQKPLSGPGSIPKKHMASLTDALQQEQLENATRNQEMIDRHLRDPVAVTEQSEEPQSDERPLEAESFRGSSFMSSKDIEEEIRTSQNDNPNSHPQRMQPPPQRQQTPMSNTPPMPSTLAKVSPAARRSLQDLFTTGVLSETIRIAGFDLKFKTLTSDEYARAWVCASVFPEGTARDIAIKTYLLAFSCTHINDSPVENQSKSKESNDPIAKRYEVFSRIDNELLRRFFENGYGVVRKQSEELLEKIDAEASETANFTPATR
jgi:hypothetical protein